MRATDVVGWVLDGAAYCVRHKPAHPDALPVFACDDVDGMTCDVPHATYLRLTFETLLESWVPGEDF